MATAVLDAQTHTNKEEFIAEGEETFTFYSDESSDEYDYHDNMTTSTATATATENHYDIDSSDSESSANSVIIAKVETPLTLSHYEKDDKYVEKEPLDSGSSISSVEDDNSYFDEKPTRTFSEDTVITPPPSKSPTLSSAKDEEKLPAIVEQYDNDSSSEEEQEEEFKMELEERVKVDQEEKEKEINIKHGATAIVEISPPSPLIQQTAPPLPRGEFMERKLSHKLSSVSFSDMNDVSLEEDHQPEEKEEKKAVEQESYNPLKIITSALASGKKPQITAASPVPTRTMVRTPTPPPKDIIYETTISPVSTAPLPPAPPSLSSPPRQSLDNVSISSSTSTSTAKSIFALWSPFRSSSSANTSPATSRRPSKQNSAPAATSSTVVAPTPRPSASFVTRQKRLSRPTSIISPLPGFQEALLAQMEQLNSANTSDPKSKVIKNLKRQSIRHSLVSQNKGDDYDWDFWAGIMCDFQNLNKVSKELIKHIRVGIPPSIRGMLWQLLAKSKDEDLVTKYIDYLKLPSPYDKMIQRDLARTFPGHVYFKETDGQGQEGLYNVVRAYSLYDHEVGYCQGLAFIVGPMLLNMPDEDAFCVLIQLMNKYGLRGHFTPEMDGLQLRLYQFDALVQENLPHVARHLNQQGINSTMYASQWFMTLFAYKFPLNLVYRIYDVIFTEGITSIFKFAIALLKRNQTTILGLDFEHLLDFLKNGLFEEYKDDDRKFVSDACELEFPARKILQLEKEHKAIIQKELAEANMIEELQKSNLELKKQLNSLEQKTNTLKQEQNDVSGQLKDTLHHLSALKDEGTSLKTLVTSLDTEVTGLPEKIEAKCKDEFEGLCSENASLIGKNSSLEDQLQKAESVLIDIKIRYAQSENDKEELHQRLYELKKLMSF